MRTFCAPRSVSAKIFSDIELKVASTRAERQAAFELVYRSYSHSGLCAENDRGLRFTPYQLLATTDVIVAQLRGEVISTLSLVRDGELGLPLEEIYPAEVAERRAAGSHLAEVSCLADRRETMPRFFELFCELSRVMAQLAVKLTVDELLVAVHPRHAALYRRYMAFEQFGSNREYPTVCGNPAVALRLNLTKSKQHPPRNWQQFFGEPLPDGVLKSSPIPESDREFFLSLAEDNPFCQDGCRIDQARGEHHSEALDDCLLCA
jgi:hypothetical protein